MPTLTLRNGNKMAVDSAEEVHGVFIVSIPGGGRVFIPAAQVSRLDGNAAPSTPSAMVARPPSDAFISPGLGRPTSDSPPYAIPTRMPVAQPPGAERISLGSRSDPADYGWAARAVTEYQDPEVMDLYRKSVEAYNVSNPAAPIDAETELQNWSRYWAEGRHGQGGPSEGYED